MLFSVPQTWVAQQGGTSAVKASAQIGCGSQRFGPFTYRGNYSIFYLVEEECCRSERFDIKLKWHWPTSTPLSMSLIT